MAVGQWNKVFQDVRTALERQDAAGTVDADLLTRFVQQRDEAAFEALVRRHGPMVLGVCRRVLQNVHDAEDAFQATFLVLVRKASTLRSPSMIGNWLYGVAYRTALHARDASVKRRAKEAEMVSRTGAAEDSWADLRLALDQELERLPDKYRAVIVLCDLEGKTRKEAAQQLGWAEGTVASRLVRGRALLAKRLAQHGLAVSGGALATALCQNASACVPSSLLSATIRAASLVAAGQAAATGAISVKVAALTEGVMKAMLFIRLRAALAVVLILGFVATGANILTCRTAAGQEEKEPAAEKPVKQVEDKDKEIVTAWGTEVGGLQAGLGYPPGQHRTYYTGETAKLVVRARNVSKGAVKFQYLPLFFMQKPPTVADGAGKPVHFRYGVLDTARFHIPVDVNLAPGKEIVLGEAELLTTLLGTGKFTVQYERVFGMTAQGHFELDPALSKLATGKLELTIKADPPPPANEFPVGWGGGGGKDYETRVDRTVRHGGKASGSIKSVTTTPLWYGALTQAFKADKFRGQRLRMTAYVKSRDVENAAGLWMRIEGFDGKGNYSLSSDLMRTPIKGTNDWKLYQVVLDVPKEGTAQIYFGVMLAGKGQVWVDDFTFEAVGNDIKTTGGTAVETGKDRVGPAKRLPTEPKNLDFEQLSAEIKTAPPPDAAEKK
jgi:RNA polymerase sigma factor (sigma-70 family)